MKTEVAGSSKRRSKLSSTHGGVKTYKTTTAATTPTQMTRTHASLLPLKTPISSHPAQPSETNFQLYKTLPRSMTDRQTDRQTDLLIEWRSGKRVHQHRTLGGSFEVHCGGTGSSPGHFVWIYREYCYIRESRDSVVGTATRYGLGGPGIEPRWKRDFQPLSRPALGPIQLPIQRVPGLSRG